ncbi:uncharacterized protein N7483_011115 [Penicillium malachiteum]|uniref:uncharacterized protein n=1 Tax=Penicillium malachiteum TaxID=1324776 RepID=UPI002548D910|nr:uncharacterized protein N7483_011115 [Penicillium malachiteum]KAJ5713934.1 hypothetical protein N7483_011115 [Penicillium malachiteum]
MGKSCDVCQNPDRYIEDGNPGNPVNISNLNNQSGSAETGGSDLQIEFWQPKRDSGNKDGDLGNKDGDAKDLKKIYSKFESLPKTENWKELFSCDENKRKEIVRHLMTGLAIPDSNPSSKLLPDPNLTVSAINEYGKSMSSPGYANSTKSKNRPFACFRELIFCSMCAVAKINTDVETVYDSMRSVYGSDACSERFNGLIRGAKWANQAIYHLSQTKYGLRSWDILYTGMVLILKIYRQG